MSVDDKHTVSRGRLLIRNTSSEAISSPQGRIHSATAQRRVDSCDQYFAQHHASNRVSEAEKLAPDCPDRNEFTERLHILLQAARRSRESGQAHSCVSASTTEYVTTTTTDTTLQHQLRCRNSNHSSVGDHLVETENVSSSALLLISSPPKYHHDDRRLGDLNLNFSDFYCSAASYSSPQTGWCSTDSSDSILDSNSPLRSSDSHKIRRSGHFFRSPGPKERLYHASQHGTKNAHISTQAGHKENLNHDALRRLDGAHLKRRLSLVVAEKPTDDCAKTGTGLLPINMPPQKKQRLGRFGNLRSSRSLLPRIPKPNFCMKGTASLRRAQSLRSDIESSSAHHTKEIIAPILCSGLVSHSAGQLVKLKSVSESPLVDTVPTTPVAATSGGSNVLRRRFALPRSAPSFISPVPIIAPPPPHLIPIPPVSEEGRAKVRLRRFVERERRLRFKEFSDEGCTSLYYGDDVLDSVSGIVSLSSNCEGMDHGKCRVDRTDELDLRESRIEALETREVVEWILTVLPNIITVNSLSPTTSDCCVDNIEEVSDFESTTDSGSCSLHGVQSYFHTKSGHFDLYDQLVTSPQTRFHAAYLLRRYLSLVLGPEGRNVVKSVKNASSDELSDGMALVKWDVAVGCLALSVKYHRDTLPPLKPVFGSEFLLIAPHAVTYDDLEISQRNILSALSFNLGDTPQAVLDELWLALPNLRKALEHRSGWSIAQNEAWFRLFDAVAEADVLRYPISALAAAAIIEGIEVSLALKYKAEEDEIKWRQNYATRRKLRGSGPIPVFAIHNTVQAQSCLSRAAVEVEPIVRDVQAVLGMSDADFRECRRWLSGITDSLALDALLLP